MSSDPYFIPCSVCGAPKGALCKDESGRSVRLHNQRRFDAQRSEQANMSNAFTVACPKCAAAPGSLCSETDEFATHAVNFHAERRAAADRASGPDPLLVSCPACSATPGFLCLDRQGETLSSPHPDRVLADAPALQTPIDVACPSCNALPGRDCVGILGAPWHSKRETHFEAAKAGFPEFNALLGIEPTPMPPEWPADSLFLRFSAGGKYAILGKTSHLFFVWNDETGGWGSLSHQTLDGAIDAGWTLLPTDSKEEADKAVLAVQCPRCGAPADLPCIRMQYPDKFHAERFEAAKKYQLDKENDMPTTRATKIDSIKGDGFGPYTLTITNDEDGSAVVKLTPEEFKKIVEILRQTDVNLAPKQADES